MADFFDSAPAHCIVRRGRDDRVNWAYLQFQSAAELKDFIKLASLHQVSVVPGAFRVLPEKFQGSTVAFVDWPGLSRVIEHNLDDQVLSVESGISMKSLNELTVKAGQWWPVHASELSLAQVIGEGEGGPLDHGFGGPRDLILGVSVLLTNGEVITCGGKVVKNVAGYDLKRLFVGSRGYLGLILSAHLRLFARPAGSLTAVWCGTASKGFSAARSILRSNLTVSCLELVGSRLIQKLVEGSGALRRAWSQELAVSSGWGCGMLVRLQGQPSLIEEQLAELESRLREFGVMMVLPESEAELLWDKLSDPAAARDLSRVTFSGSFILLTGWLEEYRKQSGESIWQARPGRGRLDLYLDDRAQIEPLIAHITRYLEHRQQSVSVAYCDELFEYRVRRLPQADAVCESVTGFLKSRFDPQGILNPVVRL